MAKGDPCKHCGKPVTIALGMLCSPCKRLRAAASVSRYNSSDKRKASLARSSLTEVKSGKHRVLRSEQYGATILGLSLSEYREMKARQLGPEE